MADDQGFDNDLSGTPDGFFSRQVTGSRVNQVIGKINTILSTVSESGRQFTPQDAAPSNPVNGDTYLADGTNWDPAGSGNAALVVYAGGSWRVINEFTTAGGL